MKSLLKKLLTFPFHPFLIAVYPVFALYINNSSYLHFSETYTALLLLLSFTALLILVFRIFIKSFRKVALISSAFLLLCFSYVSIYNLFQFSFLDINFQRHLLIFPLCILLFSFLFLKTIQTSGSFIRKLTGLINISSGLLFISQLFTIIYHHSNEFYVKKTNTVLVENTHSEDYPDIVYLILDGYGRQDKLMKYYDLDNSSLIENLKNSGFYVADSSTANYCRTVLSLASSLNYNYIQDIKNEREINPYIHVKSIIKNAEILNFLKSRNYLLKSFDNGFSPIDLKEVTIDQIKMVNDTDFNYYLFRQTPLIILEQNARLVKYWYVLTEHLGISTDPYLKHQNRVLQTFNKIPGAISDSLPSFIFADVFSGHPPFVFDAEGNKIKPNRPYTMFDANHYMKQNGASVSEYKSGAVEQIKFINKKLAALKNNLLQNKTRPLVIIFQGDHGPGAEFHSDSLRAANLDERFPILNAIYFSDADTVQLTHDITPVNTFRIVLNKYFNQDLPILTNRNYYSPASNIYNFTDVTNKIE